MRCDDIGYEALRTANKRSLISHFVRFCNGNSGKTLIGKLYAVHFVIEMFNRLTLTEMPH